MKVLFVKLGALGDLSYALPAAKALKDTLSCELIWVVGDTYQQFLAGHPYIDQLIVVNEKKLYSKNIFVKAKELIKLMFNLKSRFDYVLIAHRDERYYKLFRFFFKKKIFQLSRVDEKNKPYLVYIPVLSTHESLAIKALVSTLINQCQPQKKDLAWEWDYGHVCSSRYPLPDQCIVIHIGGGVNAKTEFQLKRFPHWFALIQKLLSETSLPLVFVGAPSEIEDYADIKKYVSENDQYQIRCINLIGKLSIKELVQVLGQSTIFVGVDSGPLHIADSFGKAVIGLYGPTSLISWGLLSPLSKTFHHSLPCSPCYKDDGIFPVCPINTLCMHALKPELILDHILTLTQPRL